MIPDIETRAWNCGEWSADFHQYIYELCEHADTIGDGMSTEQLVAYAILLERERCERAATSELRNTGLLLSSPPQSSAAWEIRNRISSGEPQ